MVRQWQELLHGERYSPVVVGKPARFRQAGRGVRGKGRQVTDPAELDDAIREMIAYDGPVIMDVLVEKHENCFPMIPSGKPHNEMLLGDAEAADDIGRRSKATARCWSRKGRRTCLHSRLRRARSSHSAYDLRDPNSQVENATRWP